MNEMPNCYSEATRKARKNHHCTNCGGDILAGSKYSHIKGFWVDEWKDFKICVNCDSIIRNFKLMDEHLNDDEGPALECGGISEFLGGFMCSSWHGEEAYTEIAELFSVPINYVKSVCE